MLSTRLVKLIESNWEEIANRLIREIKANPQMKSFASRPEGDIREWCKEILGNLGYLLTAKKSEEVKRRFQVLGKMRFEENIPLHEAVLRLHLLKDKVLDFVHEQGFDMTAVQMWAEEELERRVGSFFDASVYHIVCGYEDAMRIARRVAS